ncbi:MAG: thioredoxin [Bacilli bacterium]|nr:thioredoxin [Bacilli bacterium]
MVKLINSKDFNEVLKNDVVLVDFFAKWCGPCKMISPIIDELSNEIDGVTFVKVDVDESSDLANMFSIMSIPTLMIFKKGELKGKNVGFMSKSEIIDFINQNR